jgi:hypothetical protein
MATAGELQSRESIDRHGVGVDAVNVAESEGGVAVFQ